MATLQIFLPDGELTHELADDIVTIGRQPDNVIQIDDVSVSSHHAQITSLDGKFELEDLDSTNGTRVNGQRQLKATLVEGMKLRFGQIETIFHSELGGENLPLPEADEIAIKVGDQTQRPKDFVNSSPFGRRSGKKDGTGKAIMAFAVLALLVGGAAFYVAMGITPPGV